MPNKASIDATPTYRGYRLQTLYTLWRILTAPVEVSAVFQPEGAEDLAIFENGILVEAVQVKKHGRKLTLSSFSPEKPDSFFYRVATLMRTTHSLKVVIASFGEAGNELKKALHLPNSKERKSIVEKLSKTTFISKEDANNVLDAIQLTEVDEKTLSKQVYTVLQDGLTGIDPAGAFDTLMAWLYRCAEDQNKITRQDVIKRVNQIGRFLHERKVHHQEWFTSIIPIEDKKISSHRREVLKEEFYRGIASRYEHILAHLDVSRSQKMLEINQKFKSYQIVIIHGASGQGKTTLAYRYLNEFFPEQWRFKIQGIENRSHTLSIATALSGHAKAIGIPIAVYIDVSAIDIDWPELVKQLYQYQNIQVLVTVREEDYRRASITGVEVEFTTIDLGFEYSEAREIYQSLAERRTPTNLLNFDDAWSQFGGEGPLMEFVYLVTQGNSLHLRLSEQIKRLQDEARKNVEGQKELKLLQLVSVASAFEARMKVKPLADYLGLISPQRTFELLEKEYLLRRTDNNQLVQGLHPIRSTIITDLLTDPVFSPWSESAGTCLQFLNEEDVEIFLLNAFLNRVTDIPILLQHINSYEPRHWTAIAGVTRALLWLGVRDYVEANRTLIQEVYGRAGSGWVFMLDFDIADANPSKLWLNEESPLSDEEQQQLKALHARQSNKKQIFMHASLWLSRRTQQPVEPASEKEWISMAMVLFWLGHCNINWPLMQWLPQNMLADAVEYLSLEHLADLALGLSSGYKEGFYSWLLNNRSNLVKRFRRDTQTIVLEDDGHTLTAHFLLEVESEDTLQSNNEIQQQNSDDVLNEKAMQRITLLRKLFPDREVYACRGYGHKLLAADLPIDSTYKSISRSNLPLSWFILLNTIFRGLGNYFFRPQTWREYAITVDDLRHIVVQKLRQLEDGLNIYFRQPASVPLIESIDMDQWNTCIETLRFPPLLPKCAVDAWGFIDEISSKTTRQNMRNQLPLAGKKSIAMMEYEPFRNLFMDYVFHLTNFFTQSLDVLTLNPALRGKDLPSIALTKQVAEQNGIQLQSVHLSTINLADAVKILSKLQEQFRRLLGNFVGCNDLEILEHEENLIVPRVLSMWYFFAFRTDRVFQNAMDECPKLLDDTMNKIRNTLNQELHKISSDSIRVAIITETVEWQQEPALWLSVDGISAVEVFNSLDSIIIAIRKAIPETNFTSLRHYALDIYWRYIVIVPFVRGKCLKPIAWRFYIPILTGEYEIGFWNYMMQVIPQEAFAKLRLAEWKLPQLEVSERLWQATIKLSLLTAHLRDFQRLPEIDEQGFEQLQSYVTRLSIYITQSAQSMIDAASEMLQAFLNLPASEYQYHANMIAAVDMLGKLNEIVPPKMNTEVEQVVSLDEMINWADRLEQGRNYPFLAYLYWATDIIDKTISTG